MACLSWLFSCTQVARQAFGVITLKIGNQINMRIMARNTSNALVSWVETAAVFKTVGLKTHVENTMSIRG